LQPATAQTLALALHELVTNSAKYGALSTLSGQLSIAWKAENDMLALTWIETDGPRVREPTSRGFGTRSLIASVESQLGGKALFDWRAEGLVCRLSVPLAKDGAQRQPNRHPSFVANGSVSEAALRSAGAKG
jgi:two-component sensor histidine kinase